MTFTLTDFGDKVALSGSQSPALNDFLQSQNNDDGSNLSHPKSMLRLRDSF